MCTSCHTTITKENKRIQLKQFFNNSLKSSFSTYYEEVYFLVSVVQRDLPKFKALLSVPLTPSSLKVLSFLLFLLSFSFPFFLSLSLSFLFISFLFISFRFVSFLSFLFLLFYFFFSSLYYFLLIIYFRKRKS